MFSKNILPCMRSQHIVRTLGVIFVYVFCKILNGTEWLTRDVGVIRRTRTFGSDQSPNLRMSRRANMAARPVHERASRDGSVVWLHRDGAWSMRWKLRNADRRRLDRTSRERSPATVTATRWGVGDFGEWRGPSNMAAVSFYETCLSRFQLW